MEKETYGALKEKIGPKKEEEVEVWRTRHNLGAS
jgi:hypothetical protein